jgi:arylsulfatase A-like enzyme
MNWIKGFLLLIIAACGSASNAAARPNLIFVMADDLGYADLGCYGQNAFVTPNLNLMAAEGMRFTAAYSGSTVCAPARSTLMTGMHVGHTSVRSNTGGVPLLQADVTVAEVLKQAGYATGGFGKWGLGDLDTTGAPENQGFDRFVGYYHQVHAHDYYPEYLIDTGKKMPLPGNQDFHKNNPGSGGMPDMNDGKPAQFAHYIIKQAMFDWIRASKDQPFFCYAPWTPPHAQFEMPASDPAWQSVKDAPWSDNAKGHAAFTIMLDRDMGELFGLLRELGIDDNTVVFFCSDNGSEGRYDGVLDSSGPLRGFKRSLYEGGIRVPFIARWPGMIKPAQRSGLPIYFPDVMPTLAELGGVDTGLPTKLDGLSFAPTLLGRPDLQLVHDYLYWEWTRVNWGQGERLDSTNTAQAVRIGQWKAVRDRLDSDIELYDLSKDLGETNNIAPDHPIIVQEIDRILNEVPSNMRPQPEPKRPEGQQFR